MAEGARPIVLTDDDIRVRLTPEDALTWTEEALARRAAGTLVSPPRVRADLGDGHFAFTVGASRPDWYGYRAYDTRATTDSEQVVVAHDATTGEVVAVAIGNELGARRTGALGGVAAKHLTGGTVRRLAVIGAGRQAWTQAWAISGFAHPEQLVVHSRTPDARNRFADRARAEFGWEAQAVEDAQTAVEDADLVVLATNSATPVIDTGWLADDVVVITVGPKQVGRAEFAPDLIEAATLITTDSREQLLAYDPPALLAGRADAMTDLAELTTGAGTDTDTDTDTDTGAGATTRAVAVPTSGRRVHCSVGLAGTEVHLLGRLANLAGVTPSGPGRG